MPVRYPLSIIYRDIPELTLDPANPRLHSRKQIKQIAKSVKEFGFNVPVLIDAQGKVIAGHGRVLACQMLGITIVPTISLEHLTETQVRAFMVADNKLTENSTWDEGLLRQQFKALAEVELDFDLEATGFEVGEIDVMLEGPAPSHSGKEDPADLIPDSLSEPQVSRPGDQWALDRHRVYCGDARDEASYSRLMAARRATMVFADPPYNDPIDRYVTGFGKIHHREFSMASGELSAAEFTEFLGKILRHLARHGVDGVLVFVCMDWRHSEELLAAGRSVGMELKNVCVWVKESAGQGSLYRSQHELIFVFKHGKKPHRNNIQLGKYGRYRTNVWTYRRVNALSRNSEDRDLPNHHPTIKPVDLVADAILDCTARRDVVLDPFLGSGTTVMAAERTGRICYGMELDPRYVDLAVRRWQAFTGGHAIQESTGRTFNDIEEEYRGQIG